MSFQDFFNKYFIHPVYAGEGYNVVNTTAYALLFILFAYGFFETLKKLKIKIDRNFVLAFIPLTLFAISMRVFQDAGIVKGYWFVTPGIWVLFIGIILSTFSMSLFIQKRTKIPYHKIMQIVGLTLLVPALFLLQIKNLQGISYVALVFLPLLLTLKFVKWSPENKVITTVHAFDAIVTFVSIEFFNYKELHVIPRFVINLTGTVFSFIVLKLVIVVSVLLLLDKYTDDNEFKNYIKFMIGILGFVPGIRDFLRLIWLV